MPPLSLFRKTQTLLAVSYEVFFQLSASISFSIFCFLFFRIKNLLDGEINSMPLSHQNLPFPSFAVDGACCRNFRRGWTTAILPCPIKRRRTMRKTWRTFCCEFRSSMLPYSSLFASTRLFALNSITFVSWRKRRRWRTSHAVAGN